MKHYFKKATSLLLAVLLAFSIVGIIPASAASDGDINLALGKTLTFGYKREVATDASWGVTAVNNGIGALTDGVKNNVQYAVNNADPTKYDNQPNIGIRTSNIEGPYSLTLDLGDEYPINRVSLFNYTRVNWGVHPMEDVTYSYSTDGTNWFVLDTVAAKDAIVQNLTDPKYTGTDAPLAIYEFALTFKPVNARYVKADFANNSYGIIALNEFEVYTTNLAYGKSVSFEYGSQVTANANWDANAVKNGLNALTNGINNSPYYYVNNSTTDPAESNPYIGLNQAYLTGPYAFILDLGEITSIGRIQSYFYDRTEWSVAVPAKVNYFVSSDGISWNPAGTVASSQASTEEGFDEKNANEQQPTIYNFRFDGNFDNVRYVKVAFEAHSNKDVRIGVGEIEAFEATEGYACKIVNDTITITDYIGTDTELEIPVEINGYPVTAIADNAFGNCTELRTVVIPDTIESIGANTFKYCTNITIYNPDCAINGTMGSSNAVITSYKNSTAQAYATENNLTFIEIECPNHIWNHGEVVKAETCTEDGEELYTCKLCKETKSIIIPATGHSEAEDWTVTKEAACTEKGEQVKYCTACEIVLVTEVIPATGHTEANEWIITKDATCGEDGERIKYCTVCEEVVKTEAIPATGHITTGEWIIEKYPNCVEAGRKVDICILCGDIAMSEEIPALGHTEVIDPAVVATCTDTGLTEGSHCADCNEIITPQVVTKHTEHIEEIVDAKNATYFEDGYTGDTICSECETVISNGESIDKKTLNTPKVVIKNKNKKFTVKYKKVAGATGFVVKYKYKGKTIVNKYETAKTAKKAFKNLSKGNYKIRVRAYVEQDNQIAYSGWTTATKVKIK